MTCTIRSCPACAGRGARRRCSSCSQATLPELRRGLTESAARTVAYELFEKLGFGAVAVTDTHEVLAFVGAGADHHARRRPADPPGVRGARRRTGRCSRRSGSAPSARHPACPLGAAAVVPLRLTDGPAGAVVAYATARLAARRAGRRDARGCSATSSRRSCSSRSSTSATTTALQAQMEPHFVFNALNTIASFIRTEPERARRLVLAFADHLRSRLARPGEFVTLEEELRHVQSYLELEQARFGSQLEVTIDAAPDALAVRLPPLLVQPLVENAIKHGKTDRPLHLLVRARVRRGRLRVTVRDDGRGIAREAIERVLEPGVGRGHRPRARERQPAADRALRRGRAAALVPVRHGRAARGAGRADDPRAARRRRGAARSELRYLLAGHAGRRRSSARRRARAEALDARARPRATTSSSSTSRCRG